MLNWDSEIVICSRFVIWTQPSGPLCLWQCFNVAVINVPFHFILTEKQDLVKVAIIRPFFCWLRNKIPTFTCDPGSLDFHLCVTQDSAAAGQESWTSGQQLGRGGPCLDREMLPSILPEIYYGKLGLKGNWSQPTDIFTQSGTLLSILIADTFVASWFRNLHNDTLGCPLLSKQVLIE